MKNALLWLACSAIFFEAFDVSVVNLALPLMAADLHIPLATAQWVQTIYLLTFGGFLLLGGRLSDHYGSAVIFIAGMSLFACASALGYVSRDIRWLLPARAGQGIGAALAMPAGISLLSRYFSGERQQWAFGIFGAFAAVGFAGGLAIGGLIATLADWHWIFGVNVPVIALVVVVAWRHIPRPERPGGGAPPNAWMAAWLTLTVLVLSGAVQEAARLGWWTLPCVAGSLLSGLWLWRVDRRLSRPFFGTRVYVSREAYRGLAAFALLGAGFLPFVFTCTLGLGVCLGQGTLAKGLWLFPQHRVGAGEQIPAPPPISRDDAPAGGFAGHGFVAGGGYAVGRRHPQTRGGVVPGSPAAGQQHQYRRGLSRLYGHVPYRGAAGKAGSGGGDPKHVVYGRLGIGIVLH